ncbi:hypothetical protein CR513_27177, partial [Mucuna pruriens]
MGGKKGSTQMWVNQTTSDKENVVEHPSTLQLDQDIQAFSKEEMDCLQALLNSTSKSLGSCGLTMNGKSFFNISSSVLQSIWIIDYGVTDHMTSFPSTSYLKISKKQLIIVANGDHVPIVANGDHVPIVGSRNVQLHSSLSLHNICNNTNKEELSSSQWATSEIWAASQIWLYHKRLGHPLFGLLKTMFPYLFIKESTKSFKCDIFLFSKHHRATFFPSNNKILEPFDLIHFDVWGQLVTLYRGLSDLYRLLMIVPMWHGYFL